jgi:hypothetical protein
LNPVLPEEVNVVVVREDQVSVDSLFPHSFLCPLNALLLDHFLISLNRAPVQ